jgi:hypothetical protein
MCIGLPEDLAAEPPITKLPKSTGQNQISDQSDT